MMDVPILGGRGSAATTIVARLVYLLFGNQ